MTIRTAPRSDFIPTRHGRDIEAQRAALTGLRRAIPVDPEPSAERWRDLGEALMKGDPVTDALVESMMTGGFRASKARFDQAAARGIASIPDPEPALLAFFTQVEATPDWVDAERLKEGARCNALAGRMGSHVLRDVVILAGYQLSAVNKTLIATGALKNGASKRLIETNKWFLDCMRPGGMQKFGPGYVSTLQVRLVHGLVRRQVQRMSGWNVAEDGLPINQLDMHNTYLGLSAVYLLASRLMGIPFKTDEAQAIMEVWRYIGWLMGIDEDRLHKTEAEALVALYQNSLSQPGPDESSRALAGALVDEPLSIRFGVLPGLRGRWDRAVHLSISRAFIGKDAMETLGLPRVAPWYPLLTGPFRFIGHKLVRLLPGGRDYLIRRGRAQQESEVRIRAGSSLPTQFAGHIQTAAAQASHPGESRREHGP